MSQLVESSSIDSKACDRTIHGRVNLCVPGAQRDCLVAGTARWCAIVCAIVCAIAGVSTSSGHAQPPAASPATPADAKPPVAAETPAAGLLPAGPTEADFPHLHNLLRINERIYSGGEPADDEAFAQLARLGVRTIVSVDGAPPNLAAARRHGLRYVHIPIGYDGLPEAARLALTRVARDQQGPIYVHCHHGKHRGPAAAAILCVADGTTQGKPALAILEKSGTNRGYSGLWRDVARFQPPAADVRLPELVEVADVGSVAAAMAQIDRIADQVKRCAAAEWQAPAEHPDLAPRQQALLLREGFRETTRRLEELNNNDPTLIAWMRQSEKTAANLEASLAKGDPQAATQAWSRLQRQCARCHDRYRDP